MLEEAALRSLLEELAAAGEQHDAREPDKARQWLNITPDTGEFLRIVVRAVHARTIVEVGTSNGYSTVWLAWAASETGGHVITIERNADKIALAASNLRRAGLADLVTIRRGDARELLASLPGPADLVFLDADRHNYLEYLGSILALLRPGGLLITDNVLSHAGELAAFSQRLKSDPGLATVTIPLGKGEELTCKLR